MDTNITTTGSAPQEDAQRDEIEQRFMLAYGRGESLKEWITRYPLYARDLAELALAVDAQRVLPDAAAADSALARDAFLRALEALPVTAAAPGLLARAQALALTIPELAKRLQITPDLLFKLDQGYVRLETVPRRFLAHLARGLQTTVDSLLAGLQPGRAMAGNMAFSTKDRPQAARQVSFLEALGQARGLTPAARQEWEEAARAEGLEA